MKLYLYNVYFKNPIEGKDSIPKKIWSTDENDIPKVKEKTFNYDWNVDDILHIQVMYEVNYINGEDGEEYYISYPAEGEECLYDTFYQMYDHEDSHILSYKQVSKTI